MADMTTIKGKIRDTIYPNGTGAITADKHQALLLEMVDDINTNKADVEALTALEQSLTLKADKSEVASQLTKLSEEIDNLPKGDEFDAEGNYPSLRVGTADTAIDLAGRGESVPAEFGFRASGGKSIKDGRAYIKRIKGNSVVWNNIGYKGELVGDIAQTLPEGAHIVQGHKYLFRGTLQDVGLYLYTQRIGASSEIVASLRSSDGDQIFIAEMSAESNGLANTEGGLWWYQYSASNGKSEDVQLIDLTQMFQAGNEPTTIEDFNARVATLGVDMYAYNEGQVIHCNTESIKSVGDNAWDEEWENGEYSVDNGLPIDNKPNSIRSKHYIPVIPGAEYYSYNGGNDRTAIIFYDEIKTYISSVIANSGDNKGKFTTPTNARYIRLFSAYGSTYNHDICIRLAHTGYKTDYEPYWQDTLPLPIIRKYFPDGMKKAGSAHDEIRFNKASGKWEAVQRIAEVDMGSLSWNYDAKYEGFFAGFPLSAPCKYEFNAICVSYPFKGSYSNVNDKESGYIYSNRIFIKDSFYTDAASFKAAMAGVILYYELAEPIVTELDEADQNFRDYYQVADFGTEMSQSSVPSAPFSADIIYQFNAVDMIREHEIEINELQSIIATMQAQLASLASMANL